MLHATTQPCGDGASLHRLLSSVLIKDRPSDATTYRTPSVYAEETNLEHGLPDVWGPGSCPDRLHKENTRVQVLISLYRELSADPSGSTSGPNSFGGP